MACQPQGLLPGPCADKRQRKWERNVPAALTGMSSRTPDQIGMSPRGQSGWT